MSNQNINMITSDPLLTYGACLISYVIYLLTENYNNIQLLICFV